MNTHKILFPTDLSVSGKRALELATALARDSGATLLVVHVEEPVYGEAAMYSSTPDDELRKTLDAVVPTDPAVPCEHQLLIGNAIDQILQTAKNEHVDMIVMPTHGRTGLARFLMGSVAEAVVRRAECPVLTVRQPAAPMSAA